LINAGTKSEEIGLLMRPRKACYLDFWSGWLQVTHNILYSDKSKVDVTPLEKDFVWMYPDQNSGLWFPPGRVLVCDDKLDFAIYMNQSELVQSFSGFEDENAAALGRSQDIGQPSNVNSQFVAVFARAARALASRVDTLVFTSHADASLHGLTRRLVTEYVLMPTSHTFRPLGCPVSSAFRMDANYVLAHGKPGAQFPTPYHDNGVFDALLLAPCNCSASTSPVC
jgi:hypothetical protein